MATTGSFDLNLETLEGVTNKSVEVAREVSKELAAQGSLIGLGIAIAIALVLIFGAVFIVLNFIPRLIGKMKGLKGA